MSSHFSNLGGFTCNRRIAGQHGMKVQNRINLLDLLLLEHFLLMVDGHSSLRTELLNSTTENDLWVQFSSTKIAKSKEESRLQAPVIRDGMMVWKKKKTFPAFSESSKPSTKPPSPIKAQLQLFKHCHCHHGLRHWVLNILDQKDTKFTVYFPLLTSHVPWYEGPRKQFSNL